MLWRSHLTNDKVVLTWVLDCAFKAAYNSDRFSSHWGFYCSCQVACSSANVVYSRHILMGTFNGIRYMFVQADTFCLHCTRTADTCSTVVLTIKHHKLHARFLPGVHNSTRNQPLLGLTDFLAKQFSSPLSRQSAVTV